MTESSSENLQSDENQLDYLLTMDQERVYSIHRISPDPFMENWNRSPSTHAKTHLMRNVYELFSDPDSCDISIHIGEAVKNCFILVLQSYSTFFQRRSRHEKVVALDSSQITPEIFQKIYVWMLDSTKAVKRDGLVSLLIGAQYLKVAPLEQEIWHLIQDGEKFQECEAFLLYMEAKQCNCEKIQSMMIGRVQQFFMTVVCSEEFLKMDPIEITNWLKLDSIAVSSEVDVFYSAARWLMFDWDKRKNYLTDVMKTVRLGLIEPWRICEFRSKKNVGKLSSILESSELQNMLESSLSYSTYRNCFQDDLSDQFQDFLSRFELKRLFPREMLDHDWQTKYQGSAYTYERFEECLNHFRSNAFVKWRNSLK